MSDYNNLELSDLYDLLAACTVKYTKMLSIGATNQEEFNSCKEMIDKLQILIESRQLNDDFEPDIYLDGLTPAIA
jgi:hypothetical protein